MIEVNNSDEIIYSITLKGERLHYNIEIKNRNSFNAKDVSEEFVLKELHQLTVERINEIHNDSSPEHTSTAEVTEL